MVSTVVPYTTLTTVDVYEDIHQSEKHRVLYFFCFWRAKNNLFIQCMTSYKRVLSICFQFCRKHKTVQGIRNPNTLIQVVFELCFTLMYEFKVALRISIKTLIVCRECVSVLIENLFALSFGLFCKSRRVVGLILHFYRCHYLS